MTLAGGAALGALVGAGLTSVLTIPAEAATAEEIESEVGLALERFHREVPQGQTLQNEAVAALVFPRIIKGGLIVGGQYGEGALLREGKTEGYYSIASASFGFQAGAQAFSMILLFMNEDVLDYLDESRGFELGVDAGFVLADVGEGGDLSTTTIQNPVVAYVFGEQGLMAGISIEGSKITRIDK